MSICIAAMYNGGGVIGVTDRMFSLSDASYEPIGTTRKIFGLAPYIKALTAGHIGVQSEIMTTMQGLYNAAKVESPDKAYTVKELADSYVECLNEIKRNRIRENIFSPWNLTEITFVAKHKEFSDIFINDIFDRVARFVFPAVETIICGLDESTGKEEPHIYRIKFDGNAISVECCDAIGYATVGIGERHVESQFMQSGFSRHFSLSKVIFLTYLAKRRSEVAQGIGKETDMLFIEPKNLGNQNLSALINLKKLEEIYQDLILHEKGEIKRACSVAYLYMKDILKITPSWHDDK